MQQHLLAIFFPEEGQINEETSLTDDGRVLISKQSSVPRINTILTLSYSQRTALNSEKGSQIHQNKKEHIPGEILVIIS